MTLNSIRLLRLSEQNTHDLSYTSFPKSNKRDKFMLEDLFPSGKKLGILAILSNKMCSPYFLPSSSNLSQDHIYFYVLGMNWEHHVTWCSLCK